MGLPVENCELRVKIIDLDPHRSGGFNPVAFDINQAGLELIDFERVDECCGFGGTFAATEEAVSAKMGYDKLGFMLKGTPDCIVTSDMSCLMHLEGCARRQQQTIPFLHLAEILNGAAL